MATKTKACSTCCTNCLIMHNKEHGYSASEFSFFKIMFGKDFANFMVIPPTFIKRHQPVEGKRIILEDSSGNGWDVILSNVDGSLAFERGWNTFVVDHGIEMGDILMFYLIKDSHFMVGIYGRSGCPKNLRVSGERPYKKRVPEVIRQTSYMKRPRQHSALRTINACGYSESDIEVIPKRFNNVRESSVLARNVPRHRNINERHNAVPAAETLVEPCFMSDRETNTDMEKDRNILLDLSNFEMPGKKRITDREEESDYLLDLANLELPQIEPDFNQNGKLHEVSDTLQDSEAAMADKKTHIDGLDVADYLLDMSFFNKPESEDANGSTRVQLDGITERKEPDKVQTAETEAASVNPDECHISERKLEESPLTGEVDFSHERTKISSSPTSAGLPLDSIMTQKFVEPSQTPEFPSPPGCSRLNSQNMMEFKQEICGNVVADSCFSASCSVGEPQNISRRDLGERSEQMVKVEGGRATLFKQEARDYNQSFSSNAVSHDCHGMDFPIGNLDNINSGYLESLNHVRGDEGGKATLFKQEARDFNQISSGNAVPDDCLSTDFPTGKLANINSGHLESLNHVMRDEGETRKIIKREAIEFNSDLCGAAVAESSHRNEFSMGNQAKSNFGDILGNFSNVVNNTAYANVIVKPEPVDIDLCDTPTALSSITCTIPPDTDDYLELPEPLPVQAMSSWKLRLKVKQHFVLLRGADDKLWPVVYHQKLKSYVLASGWKPFMKGNNIQSGDLCMFTAEHIQENTFTVQVLHP